MAMTPWKYAIHQNTCYSAEFRRLKVSRRKRDERDPCEIFVPSSPFQVTQGYQNGYGLLAGRVTTLRLSRPLSVSQHGQLSHPSLPM